MKIATPTEITEAKLTASNVPMDDYPLWASGTTYNTGERVINGIEAWEALKDSVTSEPSTAVPLDWLRLGYINRWRMFRDGRDSVTSQIDRVNITFVPGTTDNTVAVLGLVGHEVELTVTDPVEGVVFSETKTILDISVVDWWEYFFLPYDQIDTVVFEGLPPYPDADYDLSIRAATVTSPIECGRVVTGLARSLGVSNYGTSVGVLDYSTKERDGFGNLTLVPRRTIRLVNFDVTVQSERVAFVQRVLEKLSTVPTLYIGDELYTSTIVFGVYRDFTEVISSPSISDMTIEVEGF